jgi:hypothetical protein
MKIGVLIYTYNRTDDARINMEIIRNVWKKSELLKEVVIVHTFNGQKEWWPEKYLEDELLYLDNPGHFEGAEVLINGGVKCFSEKYPDIDYVILLASDTWLVKPEYLEKMILDMQKEEKYLATAVWGTKKLTNIWTRGSALDFNIFNLKWAIQSSFFPLRFKEFKDKYEDLFFYNDQTIYPENVFVVRFREAIFRSVKIASDNILKPVAESHIYKMVDREPVHTNCKENLIFKKGGWKRKMYVPKMGLITHHNPIQKQKIFKEWKLTLGESGNKFLSAKDLSYYNRGLDKNLYIKNGKKIVYGD